MRVLIALDDADIANVVEPLAEIAGDHEIAIACPEGAALGLALADALPDRDVVTVLSQVVISDDDPAVVAPSRERSADPIAIVELRSVRGLIASGSLVICVCDEKTPVVIGEAGTMQAVEATVNGDLLAALLARRLDVDLFVLLTDGGPSPAKEEAARRFTEATGRPAAIGELKKAVEIVLGESRARVAAHRA